MNEHKKWYITVSNERIEVSEEVYRAYWHYTEKERYFMSKLKQGKFVSDPEKGTAEFTPSREDSLERLNECGFQFHDPSAPMLDDIITSKEMFEFLNQALEELSDDEYSLIQELFYWDRTERELANLLHIASSAVNRRKKLVLNKLKQILEKKL